MLCNNNVNIDWVPYSKDFGDDVSELFVIYYIGTAASAIVDIASTGDITFKHGVLSSEAADDDIKLDADENGIIDLDTDVTDYASLKRKIDSSDNWRCKLTGALPDDDPHTTTTGHFTEVTGGTVVINPTGRKTAGYTVMTDDTDSKYIVAALTLNDHPDIIHNHDGNVHHELNRVIALSTYASGSSTLKVYACDDRRGTSRLILTLPTGATTVQVAYPLETYNIDQPLVTLQGERLVVKLLNSAAMSVVRLKIEGRSLPYGTGPRASKMRSAY